MRMRLDDLAPMLRWKSVPDMANVFPPFHEDRAQTRLASDRVFTQLRRAARDVAMKRLWPRELIEDVVLDTYLTLSTRMILHDGLAVPDGWEGIVDWGPWFRTAARNAAKDVLNASRWSKFDGLWDLPRDPTDGQYGGQWGHQIHNTHAAAYVDFIARLAETQPLRNPNWLLAHVALGLPGMVTRNLVDEAKRWRSGKTLHRSADETWELMQWWSGRHQLDPRDDLARRDLAWVLRSRDTEGPLAWRRDHPDAVRAGRNLMQNWDGHARSNGVLELRWPGIAA